MTRDDILAIIQDLRTAKAPGAMILPERVIAYNEADEARERLEVTLAKRGATILDKLSIADGYAVRYHYQRDDGVERWAYVVQFRADVDVWLEESLICDSPILDDLDALHSAFFAARNAAEKAHQEKSARIQSVEEKWTDIWPSAAPYSAGAVEWLVKSESHISYVKGTLNGEDLQCPWFSVSQKAPHHEQVAAMAEIYRAWGVL